MGYFEVTAHARIQDIEHDKQEAALPKNLPAKNANLKC